jgi:hypothetical protein
MTAAQYVSQWMGQLSAAAWVLQQVTPILLAAGACRLVTFIYNPHR